MRTFGLRDKHRPIRPGWRLRTEGAALNLQQQLGKRLHCNGTPDADDSLPAATALEMFPQAL